MQKYVAYNIYSENVGKHAKVALQPDGRRREVYLAEEADAEFSRLRDIIAPGDAAAYEESMAAMKARIAELERAAKVVCDYDWSDNDEDAVRAVEKLRSLMERSS